MSNLKYFKIYFIKSYTKQQIFIIKITPRKTNTAINLYLYKICIFTIVNFVPYTTVNKNICINFI